MHHVFFASRPNRVLPVIIPYILMYVLVLAVSILYGILYTYVLIFSTGSVWEFCILIYETMTTLPAAVEEESLYILMAFCPSPARKQSTGGKKENEEEEREKREKTGRGGMKGKLNRCIVGMRVGHVW